IASTRCWNAPSRRRPGARASSRAEPRSPGTAAFAVLHLGKVRRPQRRPPMTHEPASTPTPPSGSDRERIIAAFMALLAETSLERLFDVLMRRIEMLAPHKQAMRSLLRSATRNPGLALALNTMAVRSQQWML